MDREQRIRAMAIKLDRPVDEVRKMYWIMDKTMEETGLELSEIVEILNEFEAEAKAFGIDLDDYAKMIKNTSRA